METNIRAFLTELEDWGRKHDVDEREHSKRMLNLGPDTAQLMSILVRSGHRTRLLEIGTSNGYSTIWLAWAAVETDGHIISVERNAEKLVQAHANLRRASLHERVDLMQGDATEVIASLPGPFDFVFFDADRASYPTQLKLLIPKLVPGALLVADNALSHPDEIADYLTALDAMVDFYHVVVPIGKGLSVAYKRVGDEVGR